ncbi:SIMPL domain-containing protein [Sphingomonas sp. NCPPB 2930]|uniref:SIMPL domain-containing protein n=1 Tax=Sphingomonas sp. NCPPB 2930 TaxID=3162788 RepID=UPI0036D86C8A
MMNKILLAAALAPAVLIPGAAWAQSASVPTTVEPLVPAAGAVLDVSAEGRTSRVPDLATIRAGVVSQGATAAAALSDNAQRMARVLAAVKRAGVADRDIQTATVQLQPQYRYGENVPPTITGYQATNTLSIRFRDIAKSGSVLDALVAQGANQIDGPNLSIDNPDAALNEARTDAIQKARARAELYAKAAGLRVARIVSITENGQDAGGPERPMMMQAMARDAVAKTSIAPGERDVTVNVSVRFLLN